MTAPVSTQRTGKTAATVDAFNKHVPVGSRVVYWPGVRVGEGRESVTRSAAWFLGGHTPVVMVEGYPGGIALTHVMPVGSIEQGPTMPSQVAAEIIRQHAAGTRPGDTLAACAQTALVATHPDLGGRRRDFQRVQQAVLVLRRLGLISAGES